MQQQLQQSRQNVIDNDEESYHMTAAELEEFHANVETRVEKDFPTYARERSLLEEKIWGKIMNIFAYRVPDDQWLAISVGYIL